MSEFLLSCPCHFGLESVLAYEIKKIGADDVRATDGRLYFKGSEEIVAKANIWLRTAERVQIVLAAFKATTFAELFDNVAEINFEDYIGKNDAFPVKGWSLNSKLHSIPDCQSIIKKAVVRRFEKVYKQSWFEETGPVHQIQFSIHKDEVTIMLDTSGSGLHKRGYRQNSNLAPIKETLAAGIVDLARIRPDSIVCDPMCGSGTILIESALKALNIAPGLRRKFSCEEWSIFDKSLFKKQREEALTQINRQADFKAIGYDIDSEAVLLTIDNAKKAGVISKVLAQKQDISALNISTQKPIIICNPPYGERMLEIKQAEVLYSKMGRVFNNIKDASIYVISPNEDFEIHYGKKADKKRKLYNGMLKCNLYMYFK
ncbi:MAG TPA: RNA methyltransferase [Ruminococcaceae bacterium]|nr:RNA methyltransferase [Oscillospiraceae bacterium]